MREKERDIETERQRQGQRDTERETREEGLIKKLFGKNRAIIIAIPGTRCFRLIHHICCKGDLGVEHFLNSRWRGPCSPYMKLKLDGNQGTPPYFCRCVRVFFITSDYVLWEVA